MFRSVVYHGSSLIGEVEIHPKNSNLGTWTREIRISYISHPPSNRFPPLAVLHTISTSGVCFRMESKQSADDSLLFQVYSACLRENKTAVASIGEEELHLVAMPSRRNIPGHLCFWGYIIARGLYNSCLGMLNLRCLGIVFDLDETLLVANTMRSLEDKIDGLQRMISSKMDPQRANGMLAVIKRYQDDKSILKQYVDGDQVVENGKVFKTQSEAVPPLFGGSHQLLTRPIIRLHEKNIILTRVNPTIRDTSVLVRLRPAWEDLRNCLTANGRKWFEVYVCTMAERDYALEMWRLLDPECNLINSSELLDRIVCVKSGLRKSLFSVFHDGVCHPKLSLVIDDRLDVWDEKDQSRVLVVPPFAPQFGPEAEANNNIPVLCAARNLACNVRGSFFKDFDKVLLPRMSEIFYEDEVEYPSAPDVGNYLIPKDDTSTLIGNKNPLGFDGMADAEVERRLKGSSRIGQSIPPIADNFDTRAVVPPGPTVITPTAPAVSLTTTQFPNTVVPEKPDEVMRPGDLTDNHLLLDSFPALPSLPPPHLQVLPSENHPDAGQELLIGLQRKMVDLEAIVRDMDNRGEIVRFNLEAEKKLRLEREEELETAQATLDAEKMLRPVKDEELQSALAELKSARAALQAGKIAPQEKEKAMADQIAILSARLEKEKKANSKLDEDCHYYKDKYLRLTREVGGSRRPDDRIQVSGRPTAGASSSQPRVRSDDPMIDEATEIPRAITAKRVERDAGQIQTTLNQIHYHSGQIYTLLNDTSNQVAHLHRESRSSP